MMGRKVDSIVKSVNCLETPPPSYNGWKFKLYTIEKKGKRFKKENAENKIQ
jgi:hypothetical protein